MIKTSIVVFALLSFFRTGDAYPVNNNVCNGKSNGNYKDSDNCNGYISCVNGVAHNRACPAKLVWSDDEGICNYAAQAKPPCPKPTGTPQPNDYCKNKKDGDYVNPATCNGFISCSNGIVYQMPCPAKLVWNDKKKWCDWPNNVKPLCKPKKEAFECKQQSIKNNFCSGKGDGNYPDSSNCHGYIACSNEITYHMPCPAKLKWNDKKKRCDWPKYAYPACPIVQTPKPTTAAPTTSPSLVDYCKNKANGDYPDPTTCHGFISCSNKIVYHMPCPANLKWNDKKKQCDWPRFANPKCSSKKAPQYKCNENGNSDCKGKADGNYPDPKNCNGYIACSNEITYHMPCPSNLKWNDTKKRCDWPRYANPSC